MLELDNVSKVFKVGTFGGKRFTAVSQVSLTVNPGEVVSLIGESGSGKTTVGRMILRLTPVTTGSIVFDGDRCGAAFGSRPEELLQPGPGCLPGSRSARTTRSSRPIGSSSSFGRAYLSDLSQSEWNTRLHDSLEAVALQPADVLGKYPHQLSGGQLQRMLIARALMLELKFLVADEIISMLDASTRIDVLNLLGDLKERGLGVLFITHDLSLGNYISDRTLILRHGRIAELGATQKVFGDPQHPYTRALLASVPQLHRKWSQDAGALEADMPEFDPSVIETLVQVDDDHFVAKAVS